MDRFDIRKLRQREDVKRQKRRAKSAVLRDAPPKAQAKGPIMPGPTAIEDCSTCARLFGVERYGVPKRHVAQHLKDHRMGRIRKP